MRRFFFPFPSSSTPATQAKQKEKDLSKEICNLFSVRLLWRGMHDEEGYRGGWGIGVERGKGWKNSSKKLIF